MRELLLIPLFKNILENLNDTNRKREGIKAPGTAGWHNIHIWLLAFKPLYIPEAWIKQGKHATTSFLLSPIHLARCPFCMQSAELKELMVTRETLGDNTSYPMIINLFQGKLEPGLNSTPGPQIQHSSSIRENDTCVYLFSLHFSTHLSHEMTTGNPLLS